MLYKSKEQMEGGCGGSFISLLTVNLLIKSEFKETVNWSENKANELCSPRKDKKSH